ncbi:UDP-4-amino-4,6-dideoxy-N-acetyl-beta-L-altrosamine transaminase [Rhizobium sp.]|uniref:UDP-4-amino-4, 6-dideoxy-N-acetyl-beta-L-altrosamine transaminase n=1 Tax=Rhizobium sp. TaxID=391 RepID=UPI0028AB5D6C
MIPYGRQDISEDDIAAVIDILRSDFLTQGPTIERFERMVAEQCGVRHAVAVSNATAALHIACLALDLGPGDLAWTSPNTFVASANCALYCGADVGFVDIDPVSWNLSVERLAERLAEAERAGRLPKVLVPVHFSGRSCDMAAIGELARRYGIAVIEDASHAIGASLGGQPVGACPHSDCTVFSFHPVKIVTTGEGGVITTNSDDLAGKLRMLRSHGITRDRSLMRQQDPAPWVYEQLDLGYNYRMTDIQAALGASQMDRLSPFIQRRRELAARYGEVLAGLPLTLPQSEGLWESSWHLYVVRLRLEAIGLTHRAAFEALRKAGIGVNLHYTPVHLQPYYRDLGFSEGDFPQAERYAAEAITLPLYPGLKEAEQDYIGETLRSLLT